MSARIRNQLVDGLRQAGAPIAEALTIADLALHAANQAVLAVHRIATSLPGTNGATCAGIAFQLVRDLAALNLEKLEEKLLAVPDIVVVETPIGSEIADPGAAGATQ